MAWGGHDGDSSPGTVYLALLYTDGVASWKPQKGVPLEGSSPGTWSEAPKRATRGSVGLT